MQSDEQPDKAQLFTLVTKPKAVPHKWMGGDMFPPAETLSGHAQREWHCLNCNLVRITVLFAGGLEAERAYRYRGTTVQFGADREPECQIDLVTERVAS